MKKKSREIISSGRQNNSPVGCPQRKVRTYCKCCDTIIQVRITIYILLSPKDFLPYFFSVWIRTFYVTRNFDQRSFIHMTLCTSPTDSKYFERKNEIQESETVG